MKLRIAFGRTALRARLTAAAACALTLLGLTVLSACTSGASTPSVSSFSEIGSPAVSGAQSASSPPVTPESGSPTATQTETPTPTPTQTPSPSPSYSPIPTAAPVTGGGGTAGFQDGLLLALGAAAIVAGVGSIAYRRRLKNR
jgi:hypothetical protein